MCYKNQVQNVRPRRILAGNVALNTGNICLCLYVCDGTFCAIADDGRRMALIFSKGIKPLTEARVTCMVTVGEQRASATLIDDEGLSGVTFQWVKSVLLEPIEMSLNTTDLGLTLMFSGLVL